MTPLDLPTEGGPLEEPRRAGWLESVRGSATLFVVSWLGLIAAAPPVVALFLPVLTKNGASLPLVVKWRIALANAWRSPFGLIASVALVFAAALPGLARLRADPHPMRLAYRGAALEALLVVAWITTQLRFQSGLRPQGGDQESDLAALLLVALAIQLATAALGVLLLAVWFAGATALLRSPPSERPRAEALLLVAAGAPWAAATATAVWILDPDLPSALEALLLVPARAASAGSGAFLAALLVAYGRARLARDGEAER